ncbi:hypothetical protein PHMEG_00041028 [Phytophthora megakarya]|uniref:WLGC domain-containing protein n=1 Tax=Phytophthora megakarya TaxID=4795 RepID=A0A225UDP2_9STRA|nr:hypothetical protein PHMEG_00041028 [Phytophthora megakarya]
MYRQLTYTSTQQIPAWTKEFKNLEVIQIEGKYGSQNLANLPDDLFDDLPQLTMIQLGIHQNMTRFPPLNGVPQLQSFIIAWMPALRRLPNFDDVPNLSRLVLTLIARLELIPDLSPLRNLVEFVIYRPSTICCNGFMGPCELNHSSCRGSSLLETPDATCLLNETDPSSAIVPFLGNIDTENTFEEFKSTVCQESPFDTMNYTTFPTKETIEMCEGKKFRQCQYPPNRIGICFNARFQAISCYSDDNYIEMRRLQIKRGVGPKCDSVDEEWLGCSG